MLFVEWFLDYLKKLFHLQTLCSVVRWKITRHCEGRGRSLFQDATRH